MAGERSDRPRTSFRRQEDSGGKFVLFGAKPIAGAMGKEGNGGDMKKTMALLFILVSVMPRIALGIQCEKIDSAELKEMDKETLALTYCDDKSRSDANQETIRTFEDFSFMEDAQACMDEMLKVERIYKDSFGGDPPACGQ
jgi:hypothetical protein